MTSREVPKAVVMPIPASSTGTTTNPPTAPTIPVMPEVPRNGL
jgi:hypothetical protein